jgi:hypothetical protein
VKRIVSRERESEGRIHYGSKQSTPKLVQRPCNRNLSSGNNKVPPILFVSFFYDPGAHFLLELNSSDSAHCRCTFSASFFFIIAKKKTALRSNWKLYIYIIYTRNSGHFLFYFFTHHVLMSFLWMSDFFPRQPVALR